MLKKYYVITYPFEILCSYRPKNQNIHWIWWSQIQINKYCLKLSDFFLILGLRYYYYFFFEINSWKSVILWKIMIFISANIFYEGQQVVENTASPNLVIIAL